MIVDDIKKYNRIDLFKRSLLPFFYHRQYLNCYATNRAVLYLYSVDFTDMRVNIPCCHTDMQENHLVYRETVRKYWNTENRSQEDLYLKTIKRWERIFLEEGAEGLMKER